MAIVLSASALVLLRRYLQLTGMKITTIGLDLAKDVGKKGPCSISNHG